MSDKQCTTICKLAIACLALFLVTTTVRAETRLALVIGNASYQHIKQLDNSVNDANLIATSLNRQGFDVTLKTDTDLKGLKRALNDFFGKVEKSGAGAISVVYYAGHGIQVGGVNYLIPVDAQIEKEGDVDIEAVKADSIMSMIAYARSPLNIIILDACRNNPFGGFRSAGRGLAQIDAPTGTLVAFSTAPGKVASDGPASGNSPYTSALAKAVAEPGITIEDVFKRVRKSVSASTNGDQVPWESTSLIGDFYPAGRVPSPLVGVSTEGLLQWGNALPDPVFSVAPGSGVGFKDTLADGKPCSACPEMIVVPSGSFIMGSPESEDGHYEVEGPSHRVTFTNIFSTGRFAITIGEFSAFTSATGHRVAGSCYSDVDSKFHEDRSWRSPGFEQSDRHPVVCVDWRDAVAYTAWLSQITGKNYRLLSEAEREYVARAGTKTPFWWGNVILPSQANYKSDATFGKQGQKGDNRQKTLPTYSFSPNPWGLYNVHGNSWEWTKDCWHENYKGAPVDGSAWIDACSEKWGHVIRGGSWSNTPDVLRSAVRWWDPGGQNSSIGFRVARSP